MLPYPALPDDFICPLPQLGVLRVSGADRLTYLQSQLTQDLPRYFSAPDSNQTTLACHCDAKGKLWAVYRLVARQDAIYLLTDKGALVRSMAELKKYGVFSKVEMAEEHSLLPFGGQGSLLQAWITAHFGRLPDAQQPVVCAHSGIVICLDTPRPRFLLLLTEPLAQTLQHSLSAQVTNDAPWTLLDIEACQPGITEATQDAFIPQMLNMQMLDAISFSKGCYMGQEVVARARYLGRNKRATFILAASGEQAVNAGDLLESQAGDHWRPGGTVLSCVTYDKQTWLLAVLANDTQTGDVLRSKSHPEALFEVQPLPYQLEK